MRTFLKAFKRRASSSGWDWRNSSDNRPAASPAISSCRIMADWVIGHEFRSGGPIRPLDGLRNGVLDVPNVEFFMMARHKWFAHPVIRPLE